MISQKLFRWGFAMLVVTGLLNFIAYRFYLYWTISWSDTIVHFFGGMTVALTVLWLFSLTVDVHTWSINKLFIVVVCGALCVGIVWELYELYVGVTSVSDGIYYLKDTFSDISMDLIGGFVGFLWSEHLLKKYA